MTTLNLDNLSIEELQSLVNQLEDYKRFNKLYYSHPYSYQLKFMEAGLHYSQRYMRAGNRTGKTYGGALEFAQHLTGDYQPWFNGKRINDSGHEYWCVGVDLDSVCRVLQKELFGTADARVESELGTGAIPRKWIEMEQGMSKEGARIRKCFIKHVDGGYNTLHFFGSNNEANMMGSAVKGIWMDEEPPHNSMELYSQCVTRTATTDGFIMFTSTPEAGLSELNKLFQDDETGLLYLQSISWDDCPHMTPEVQAKLLAGIPEYQWDMRMKGLPVIGTGAVFPYKDSEVSIDTLELYHNPSLRIVAGVDFGVTVDPSTVVFAAVDLEQEKYFIIHEILLDDDMFARSPEGIAKAIKESPFPNAVVIVPHDGGLNSVDPKSKGKLLQSYGINVHPISHRNPNEVQTDYSGKKTHNSIIGGLDVMNKLFREEKLKVLTKCVTWFKEKNGYFYVPKAAGGVGFAGSDHMIDSSRIAVMGLMRHVYSTIPEAVSSSGPQWTPDTDIVWGNKPVDTDDWTNRPDF